MAEGRGQGEGCDYEAWLQIRRGELIGLRGRQHLGHGIKYDRDYHLLSDLEYWVWLLLEWSRLVLDVREQFPLFPRQRCIDLAATMGIKHPRYVGTKTLWVLTTDFLTTLAGVPPQLLAISCKYASELATADGRMFELLELERRFWESFGIPWILVTDYDVPNTVAKNLEWLYEGIFLPGKLQHALSPFSAQLKALAPDKMTLRDYAIAAGRGLDITADESVSILCRLIWNHEAIVDMNQRLGPDAFITLTFEENAFDVNAQGVAI